MGDLYLQPITTDVGRHATRFNLAGSPQPSVISSAIGELKHPRVLPGGALPTSDGPHVGPLVSSHPGAFRLTYPFSPDGSVDAGNYTSLLVHAHDSLSCKPGEHPVLLTENYPRYSNRASIAESLFESLSVPALYFAAAPVLTLYAQGLTTGGVIYVGDTCSTFTPVYQGLGLAHSCARSDLAGHTATAMTRDLLCRDVGLNLVTTAEYELAKRIKHEVAR